MKVPVPLSDYSVRSTLVPPISLLTSCVGVVYRSHQRYLLTASNNNLDQLLAEIDKTNTVIVAAAGNDYPKRPDYPARFGATKPTLDLGSLPNLIVVGATNDRGLQWRLSQYDISDPYVNIFAPGEKMPVAEGGGREYRTASGTSYGKHATDICSLFLVQDMCGANQSLACAAVPMVAGLVAYLRSLPSSWDDQLHQPANVKKLIRAISRKIVLQSGAALPRGKEVIWNGQDGSRSCFDKGSSLEACPEIPPVLAPWPGNPGGGGGSDGPTKSIDWKQGEDGPKCKASGPGGGPRRRAEGTCGGELCQGYYCQSNPKGPPPDFRDPKDPNHDGNGPPAGPIENPPKPDNPDWGVQWMDRVSSSRLFVSSRLDCRKPSHPCSGKQANGMLFRLVPNHWLHLAPIKGCKLARRTI